ncbi:hypothetical protein M3J09_013848 [Ascochyta lentis]
MFTNKLCSRRLYACTVLAKGPHPAKSAAIRPTIQRPSQSFRRESLRRMPVPTASSLAGAGVYTRMDERRV